MRCDPIPIPVRDQTALTYRMLCACGWGTPWVNDARSARQAHAAHVAERQERARLCSVTGLHDRGPDDRCVDCTVLLDATASTCRDDICRPLETVTR